MKKHIPNLLTSLNLYSGCIACVMAFQGEYFWVVFFIILSAIFDFFDGFAARWLKAYSPIGKELDSLADMVSFGVAPSLMVFNYLSRYAADLTPLTVINPYIPYIAFILAVFSALRLAKFNVDERQTTSFIGLNTPSNALFWISFIYGIQGSEVLSPTIMGYLIIALIFVFSFLMIAEIPMFSLKTKGFGIKGNELRYLLIVFIVAATILLGILGITLGVLFYIAISIFSSVIKTDK
ncbi:CDP-diacylglycerol--serine O-phosphatidyltransferase [Dysgonomonas sp. 216]|uniref:CDP-diacylglycerol--serine O-phosphatidyltransferase n=1 Tax=Dysgonomonas sp. 216 TaxID=2302934 RepID=UPI0013CFCE6D|nr:CDP-diacylglycerol--serine O-phosphatidyltransferase [Dysgonomonas sp. 216]NDW17464.1 CDP-diacylglycerol--serine O-phosphatidyltransferase [Dysgonomonas sp. 216]